LTPPKKTRTPVRVGVPGRYDLGAETKVTMRSVFSSAAELERVKGFGAVEGGRQTLERLAEWLATKHASVAH